IELDAWHIPKPPSGPVGVRVSVLPSSRAAMSSRTRSSLAWLDHKTVAFLSFAQRHAPELLLCTLGVVLRLSMLWGYDIRWSYDSDDHWPYIAWFSSHWKLPPLS